MLKTRVITACVLFIFFIPVLFFSPITILSLVMSILIALAAWEWGRFIWGIDHHYPKLYSLVILGLLLILSYFKHESGDIEPSWMAIFRQVFLWASVVFWIALVPRIMSKKLLFSIDENTYFLALAGMVVFISDWHALLELREQGLWVLLSVLMIVWTADIGAYFSGKQFGKHKLAPQISPGKSIEGVIGGMFAVFLLCFCFYQFNSSANDFFSLLGDRYTWVGLIPICIFLTLLSVMGDLFESQLKRLRGMKDSSGLLPGHGGVMDRLDALLPVLPIAALLVMGVS
jgi:phosphatidate cytidylyltransferase